MRVHRRVTPCIKFPSTQLYTWVERGTVRVTCFSQEHNTMSQARAWTRTARSEDEHTNHEATAPLTSKAWHKIVVERSRCTMKYPTCHTYFVDIHIHLEVVTVLSHKMILLLCLKFQHSERERGLKKFLFYSHPITAKKTRLINGYFWPQIFGIIYWALHYSILRVTIRYWFQY